ncbi:hypothetical protein [Bergeyella sp. RCAD1439]|uniref:hypothetical protein n=1 Tax=Bergeyella anatis TaxID=3113737 RepID=UPI002E179060|nr:hypothetical protein [Bergeyella sp. RCAD1439]
MKKRILIAIFGLLSLGTIMSFESTVDNSTSTSETTSGRKFWGWSDWNCSGNEYLTCCTRTHYILWMENAYDVQCH